ncbi:hypothetical protein Hanom_Chr04g00350941 [Helianthus anomalus]
MKSNILGLRFPLITITQHLIAFLLQLKYATKSSNLILAKISPVTCSSSTTSMNKMSLTLEEENTSKE